MSAPADIQRQVDVLLHEQRELTAIYLRAIRSPASPECLDQLKSLMRLVAADFSILQCVIEDI